MPMAKLVYFNFVGRKLAISVLLWLGLFRVWQSKYGRFDSTLTALQREGPNTLESR